MTLAYEAAVREIPFTGVRRNGVLNHAV
jgi:hypothetical protein